MNNSNNSKYIEYINSHDDEIIKYIDECFEQEKEFIKTKMIQQIREELSPIPNHYEWKCVYNSYDHSGELIEDGYISLDLTVIDFLNEYSGAKIATYESRYGWKYLTYDDEISEDMMEIASNIMLSAIRKYVENHFEENLSDDEFSNIKNACNDFDEIYENCKASDFFYCSIVAEFVGIGNIQLKNIIREKS